MSEFWKIKSKMQPDFDGGLVHNKFIESGIFIVSTNVLRNAIGPLYRDKTNETTTMAFVTGGTVPKLYMLIYNPTSATTQDSDWAEIPMGNASVLSPQGTWNADNTNPILQDTDAIDNSGYFYNVTGAPSPIVVTHPGLFGGVAVSIKNGDIIISNDIEWYVSPSSASWEALDVPQVLLDYVDGIVIAHVHEIANINGLQSALDEKYDSFDVAQIGIDFVLVPDDKLVNVAFLKQHYYRKEETYDRNQIDALVGVRDGTNFDWNRPVTKDIQIGEIVGGDTIEEGLESGLFSPQLATGEIISIDPLEIGKLISPTVKGVIYRNGADFIQSIRVIDGTGADVGSPTYTGTDAIIEFTYQVNIPVQVGEGAVDNYKLVIEASYDSIIETFETPSITITAVYLFLFGNGAAGLDAANKYSQLQKLIEIDGNKEIVINTNDDRFYFCMPEEYENRVSIVDEGGNDVLGSLILQSPVIEQVDSSGLAIDWSHNYKVYQANYDTNLDNTVFTIVIDRVRWLGTDNTLDNINEGIVNKHLTKPLKEKLINLDTGDFLTKSAYDSDNNGVVDKAATLATNGKNVSGSIIPANTLVHVVGASAIQEELFIEIADNTSNKSAHGMTVTAIPVGATDIITLKGFAVIPITGVTVGDITYLGNNGNVNPTEPASGIVQTIGAILEVIDASTALLRVNPQDTDDRANFLFNWRPFTPYIKNAHVVVDLSTVPEIASNVKVSARVALNNYTSSADVYVDFQAGLIEPIGGNVASIVIDPRAIEGDAYDMDNMADGLQSVNPATRKVTLTEAERTKLRDLQPSTYKGRFADPTALRTAFPTANVGDSADVTSTATGWAWSDILSDWEDTGIASGGDMRASVYDPAGKAVDVYNTDFHNDGVVNKVFTATEKTKLGIIEDGATADQTALEIKTAYESNANTNVYLDAEKAKLSNVEDNATADQNAIDVPYDNTTSALTALEVQAAIDEAYAAFVIEATKTMHKAVYDPDNNGIVNAAEELVVFAIHDDIATIAAGQIVYIDSIDAGLNRLVKLSSNNIISTIPSLGIVLPIGTTTSFINGEALRIGIKGIVKIPTFGGFVQHDQLYLGTNGDLTNILPIVSVNIRVIYFGTVEDIIGGDIFISIHNTLGFFARGIGFDSSTSTLTKTNVQEAIIESLNASVKWRNAWIQGTLYNQWDMVRDGEWLMVANTQTDDRPAPQPNGDPIDAISVTPTFVEQSNTFVITTRQLYTFAEGGWLKSIRLYVTSTEAAVKHTLYIVDRTDPATPIYSAIPLPPLTANTWVTVIGFNEIIYKNAVIELLYETINKSGETTYTGQWTKLPRDDNNNPNAGEWILNRNRDRIRISKTDNVGIDRTAELITSIPETIWKFIDFDNIGNFQKLQQISTYVDGGTYIEVQCVAIGEGANRASDDVLSDVSFIVPIAQSTTYVESLNYWNQPANIPIFLISASSALEFNGVDQGVTNSLFGMDLQFQRATISPDWDFASIPSTGGGVSSSANNTDINSYDTIKTSTFIVPNNVYIEVLRLVTPYRSAGLYEIKWTLTYKMDTVQRSSFFRWSIDGGVSWNEIITEAKDNTNDVPMTYFYPVQWTGGVMDFIFQSRKEGTGDILTINFIDLIFEHKS